MRLSEYAVLDATALAQLVSSRQVGASELEDVARQAIDRVNPQLNAIAGELWDAPLANGAGSAAGVPMLVKDTFEAQIQGRPVTQGSKLLHRHLATDDGLVGRRLLSAGYRILGRTTMPEFGYGFSTESRAYGQTRNPWNVELSTGGSSGGSAAVVAAGAVPIAHASDAGGSIRMPAARCGVVGMKPSRGRVPHDAGAGLLGAHPEAVLGVARSVRDIALLLDQLSGPSAEATFSLPNEASPFCDTLRSPPGRLRIGFAVQWRDDVATEPATAAAVTEAALLLEAMGHQVVHWRPTFDWSALDRCWETINAAALAAAVSRIEVDEGLAARELLCRGLRLHCDWARTLNGVEVALAANVVAELKGVLASAFDDLDIVMSPVCSTHTLPLGQADPDRSDWTLESWSASWPEYESFVTLHNIAGTPALTLPFALADDGVPIAIQVTAAPGRDALVLQIAHSIERVIDWRHRPAVHAAR